jgi:hypothetical protein
MRFIPAPCLVAFGLVKRLDTIFFDFLMIGWPRWLATAATQKIMINRDQVLTARRPGRPPA